jgi:N-acetyl-anhydromuramyl-L-alanine amidase AmpD
VPSDWVPTAKANRWHWIIIHHTATPAGALARINASHKGKGWDEAGYHFVVGNGTESRDGQIEVGPRWPKQKYGAHTASAGNEFNLHGIGIVMVGNFDETRPSRKQLESTAKLVAYLMKTYNVPASRVIGHRDAKATDCPGRYTNVADIRRAATQMMADAGEPIPAEPKLAMSPDGELLHELAGE